jgi:hypothetical protein
MQWFNAMVQCNDLQCLLAKSVNFCREDSRNLNKIKGWLQDPPAMLRPWERDGSFGGRKIH